MKAWAAEQYKKPFLGSVLMHLFLLAFFIFSLETHFDAKQLAANPGEIVQATLVDNTPVNKIPVKLKTVEKELPLEQAPEPEIIQKQQQQEQVKLEQLKKDMAVAKQQEQERLSEIQIFKEKAEKEEKEKEKKRLAKLEEQQAEEKRAKQIEQAKITEQKKKLETKRKMEDAKRLAAAKAAKDAKAAAEASEAALQANLAAAATQTRVAGEVNSIKAEWEDKIRSNKRILSGMSADLACTVKFRILPDGNVLDVTVVKSSGNATYDEMSKTAVYKSAPFILPEDPLVREEVKSVTSVLRNNEDVG